MKNYNFGNQNIGGSGNKIVVNANHPSYEQNEPSDGDNSWKIIALDLVAQGKLKEALAAVVKAHNTENVKNQVVLLLGRISKVEVEVIAGTISKQEESEELNKIRQGVVSFIAAV